MRKYLHLSSCFLLMLLNITIVKTVSADEEFVYQYPLTPVDSIIFDMHLIKHYYYYYAHKFDNKKMFPAEKETLFIQRIEKKYFLSKKYLGEGFFYFDALLTNTPSIAFAKKLMKYGSDALAIDKWNGSTLLTNAVYQRYPIKVLDFNLHSEKYLQYDIETEYHADNDDPSNNIEWAKNLPFKNSIELAKLYMGLGVDIDVKNKEGENALTLSLASYVVFLESYDGYKEEHKTYDDKHKANDIKKPHTYVGYATYYFYRTPVTYWLEEFIEAGYPASMLETHKLLYPRFMKSASVEDVKDMLDNPEAYAIEVNINCNYDKDEDETALICPLTPSINIRDAMGRTPLHIAGNEGNEDVFNYLKNNGADASIMDYRKNLAMLKTN